MISRRLFKNADRSQAHTGRVSQLIFGAKRQAEQDRLNRMDWRTSVDDDGLVRIVPNTKGNR